MALVVGTNCGFVTTAPTTNPSESGWTADYRSTVSKYTSPVNAVKITEIGWYCFNATPAANTQIGVYESDGTDGEPYTLLGTSGDFAKGTGAGWKVATGLNITISPETDYWLAVQCDNTTPTSYISSKSSVTQEHRADTYTTSLLSPWGTTAENYSTLRIGIYAVYETAATGTNLQLNIGDDWKEISAAQINIGDVWKEVAGIQINIGDTWKEVF